MRCGWRLSRWKFAARSEQLQGEQRHLFDETFEADLEAIGLELEALKSADAKTAPKAQPKRAPLPANLPRTEFRHEPSESVCACGCALKRIGEDVAEKLDYTPGVFTVHRHIRGKWACAKCQTLIQAPVAAHVTDKGIPTTGLLAQVLVAKYLDHQPLYRQEGIFARAGLAIPRSTLAQWVGACGVQLQPLVDALRQVMLERGVLHADETPVAMLVPGKGKTHRAYVWTYGTTSYDSLKAVIYDFAQSRAGENARRFLEGWRGKLARRRALTRAGARVLRPDRSGAARCSRPRGRADPHRRGAPGMSTPAPGSVGRGVPQVMASQRPDANGLRPDLAVIADWIAPGSHVLDLGCGDGALLDHLQRSKRCTDYGAEIDDAQVLDCARRGVDVIQQDIEAGLDVFAGSRFDVVVLSIAIQAIQATHQTERVLREMPYRWYDTPNLHLSTPKEFEGLGLAITRRAFLADGRPVGVMAGLRCTQAIYGFRVR